MTTIQYVCAGCGARGTVYSLSEDAPAGWYRASRGVHTAYTCSFDCLVRLGPMLHGPTGHSLPQRSVTR